MTRGILAGGRRLAAAARIAWQGLAAGIFLVASSPAEGQWNLPGGFTAIYQTEYSYGKSGVQATDNDRIFENWLNVDYARGPFSSGLRFVAFSPPDPSIFAQGPDSYGVDFFYGGYSGRRLDARGGNFYALFGRGLALRAYENRPLRVDTNLEGATSTVHLPHGELTGLIGRTVEGNAEDADRNRTKPLAGLDFEHELPLGFRLGGSLVTTDVRSQGTSELEPQRMKAARLSQTVLGVDLYGEFARVDGPNTLAGAAAPNVHGHGVYGVASTTIGRFGVVGEYKDYDWLVFENEAGLSYILPPAAIREHQYNLLNRHPHLLDTRDEIGFQLESTYNTDRITSRGLSSFLVNWSLTRNHDPDRQRGNHFDDAYAEVQQELGKRVTATAGLSFRRRFDSNETPDPFLALWTPLADLKYRLNDRHGLHFQLEHQHASSDRLGEFDTEFVVAEWSRSPNLTVGLLGEFTNKSDTQLTLEGEKKTEFIAGEISYHLLEQHEITLFLGARNAGFICVGGVCRQEPGFDGAELRLISRF